MKKTITVQPNNETVIIDTEKNTLTFDAKAGDSMKPILCNCYFRMPVGFIKDIEASKIIKVDNDSIVYFWEPKNEDGCYFYMIPQFGYTNLKLSCVLVSLFEKYEL